MIAYNITIKIVPEIEENWVRWQQEEHIPDVMSSGQFTGYKFYRLLEQPEPDGITYVVQYFASSLENYTRYLNDTAHILRQKALDKWGDQFIAFRTVMQVVH
ncbi:MAG TPA: DUF4286 family protein [Chitinophagaceae bacterium]